MGTDERGLTTVSYLVYNDKQNLSKEKHLRPYSDEESTPLPINSAEDHDRAESTYQSSSELKRKWDTAIQSSTKGWDLLIFSFGDGCVVAGAINLV